MNTSKIGILTFHRALNYGAVFQTYALQNAIEKLGCHVEIIDYRAEFNERRFQKPKLKDLLNVRMIYLILFRNGYSISKRETFARFCKKIRCSGVCTKESELQNMCSLYDKIVCGSDQVWNIACTEGDESYFLPFLNEPEKKTSYAASFGYESIPDQYVSNYRDWLNGFSSISVREQSGVNIVEQLTGCVAEKVVDPTLLLKKEEWLELADYQRVPKEKFVLLYLMSEDKDLIAFAYNLAKKENLKIVYVNDRLFKLRGALNLRHVTPEDWLGLFEKATYICTNSFHGTAFSINFEKQFFVKYIPRSIANTRLQSVLEEYGLETRNIDKWDGSECNYEGVRGCLRNSIERSYRFIQEEIIGVGNESKIADTECN